MAEQGAQHVDVRSSTWLDRVSVAWAGPVLAAATLALATSNFAMRSDIDRLLGDVDRLKQDNARHMETFERFRAPGDRFTAADGARHDIRIGKLEEQCQRCSESRVEVMARLKHIDEEQTDLCERMLVCGSNSSTHTHPGLRKPGS
jgi:hypothetical protein